MGGRLLVSLAVWQLLGWRLHSSPHYPYFLSVPVLLGAFIHTYGYKQTTDSVIVEAM